MSKCDDRSMFCKISNDRLILLIVYIDDIVIMGSDDDAGITFLKEFLKIKFYMKDLNSLKYFFDIEVTRFKKDIFFISKEIY